MVPYRWGIAPGLSFIQGLAFRSLREQRGCSLMDKKHLPYNILLWMTVAAVALMAAYNTALRSSGFSVLVGYAVPAPPVVEQQEPEQPIAGHENALEGPVDFPLELNRATREELMLIPGIGEVISGRIIQLREELGGFDSLSRLMEVKGIGEVTYEKIAAYLFLEEASANQESSR